MEKWLISKKDSTSPCLAVEAPWAAFLLHGLWQTQSTYRWTSALGRWRCRDLIKASFKNKSEVINIRTLYGSKKLNQYCSFSVSFHLVSSVEFHSSCWPLFPTLFVFPQASALDALLDDSVMFAKKLRAIGQPVSLTVVEDLPHGFLSLSQICKETQFASNICMARMREVFQREDSTSALHKPPKPPESPSTANWFLGQISVVGIMHSRLQKLTPLLF